MSHWLAGERPASWRRLAGCCPGIQPPSRGAGGGNTGCTGRYREVQHQQCACRNVRCDSPGDRRHCDPKRPGVFRGDEHDNPGRGNWFEHQVDDGIIRILVDFAHNEHGMKALADAVRQVPAERVILLMGQAGDRLDKDITDLVRARLQHAAGPVAGGGVAGLRTGSRAVRSAGIDQSGSHEIRNSGKAIEIFPGPGRQRQALSRARPGDLLVLLALTQRSAALSLIHEFIGNGKEGHG